MEKVYRNQPVTFTAALDDAEISDLIKLEKIELVSSEGRLVKSLNSEENNEGDKWRTTVVFNNDHEMGKYEVRWSFSFNGDPIYKTDYLELSNEVKIDTKSKKEVPKEKNEEFNPKIDNTIPEDVKVLLSSYNKDEVSS